MQTYTLMAEYEDLGFVIPESGTNLFIDGICIPKGAKQKEAAEKKANEKVEEDAKTYLDGLLREKYAHPGEDKLKDNELAKWVFGYENTNAATVNSTTKIENDADKDETDESKKTYSYSVTVYFLTRAASRVEDTTRDFHYILLQPSEKDGDKLFTDAQIQEMFKEFKRAPDIFLWIYL